MCYLESPGLAVEHRLQPGSSLTLGEQHRVAVVTAEALMMGKWELLGSRPEDRRSHLVPGRPFSLKHALLTLSSWLMEKIPPFVLVLEIHSEHGLRAEV